MFIELSSLVRMGDNSWANFYLDYPSSTIKSTSRSFGKLKIVVCITPPNHEDFGNTFSIVSLSGKLHVHLI